MNLFEEEGSPLTESLTLLTLYYEFSREEGATLSAIVKKTGASVDDELENLAYLCSEGFAEEYVGGRYRLTQDGVARIEMNEAEYEKDENRPY